MSNEENAYGGTTEENRLKEPEDLINDINKFSPWQGVSNKQLSFHMCLGFIL